MQAVTSQRSQRNMLGQDSLAQQAIDAIEQIENEAQMKKMGQLESLNVASAAIQMRIAELDHQLFQIDQAIAAIKGVPVQKERSARRNLDDVRERVFRWMATGRSGQKFSAGDLVREFPELEGVQVSLFLKPLITGGQIGTDASGGMRRTKYFAYGS